jgi:ribosomal protein L11 methylase PrmA
LANVPALDLRWRSGPDAATLVDLIYAQLDDFEPLAIHDHESSDGWRVFFKTSLQRDTAASALRDTLGGHGLAIDRLDVEDDNWAKRSQEGIRAIRVGRVTVAPPWATTTTDNTKDSAADDTGVVATDDTDNLATDNTDNTDIWVVIAPSTGFGTGHHETTRLCLALLQEQDVKGRRVIDVGTGSGVLAIAASKLGASTVVAFDEDPHALENARDNIERNGVGSAIEVRELDLGSSAFDLDPAAVVMANLTSGVLLKYAARLRTLVDPGGLLVISGFSPDDLAELAEAFGSSEVQTRTEGAWAASLLRFTASPAETSPARRR